MRNQKNGFRYCDCHQDDSCSDFFMGNGIHRWLCRPDCRDNAKVFIVFDFALNVILLGAFFTVIFILAFFPFTVFTVIYAVPFFFAVIFPLLFTVATFVLLDL